MLTAAELYEKKTRVREEEKALEECIMKASEYDSEEFWDAQGIISPYARDYEIASQTQRWLAAYGWRFEDDHIRAISEEEHYIP